MSDDFHRFSTTELRTRYKISLPSVYSRLKSLRISPLKEGKASYITANQLQLMDDLNTHLKSGGKVADFVSARIESDETVPSAAPNLKAIVLAEAQTSAVMTSNDTSEPQEFEVVKFVLPASERIAELEAQKEIKISSSDLQEATLRGEYRAAAKVMAEETMTRVFEATENFTIPGLKEQVEQHRQKCRRVRPSQRIANNLNDFLSQKLQAAGTRSLTASADFKSNQSATKTSDFDNT